MKLAIRSFKSQGLYGLINLLGLTISVAGSLILFFYVLDDFKYDRQFPAYKNIFRITSHLKFEESTINVPMAPNLLGPELKANFKGIINYCRIKLPGPVLMKSPSHQEYVRNIYETDTSFFKIFPFEIISGNPESIFKYRNSIAISRSLAMRFFDDIDVIGHRLFFRGKRPLVISAVFEDNMANTHFDFKAIVRLGTFSKQDQNSWTAFDNYTYVLIEKSLSSTVLNSYLNEVFNNNIAPVLRQAEVDGSLGLQPLSQIHTRSNLEQELSENASMSFNFILSGIAIFMLILGAINYATLATARSNKRRKEVGIKKLVGTSISQLKTQFLIEALLFTAISLILALVLADLLLPYFREIGNRELDIAGVDLTFYILIGIIVLVIGYVAGIYPANYMSKLGILNILNRTPHRIRLKPKLLRTGILVVQFSITLTMLISVTVMEKQINALENYDTGVELDGLLLLDLRVVSRRSDVDRLVNRIKSINEINYMSLGDLLPGGGNKKLAVLKVETNGNRVDILGKYNIADAHIVNTLSLRIISGKITHSKDEKFLPALVDKQFAAKMGLTNVKGESFINNIPIGGKGVKIVGIFEDIYIDPLTTYQYPRVLIIDDSYDYLWIKTKSGDEKEVIKKINEIWTDYNQDSPPFIRKVRDSISAFYTKEYRTAKIATYFSYFMFIVFCFGIVSYSAYCEENKRSEIGLRKVLGANHFNLAILIMKETLVPLLASIIISYAFSYVLISNWSADFGVEPGFHTSAFLVNTFICAGLLFFIFAYYTFRVLAAKPNQVLGIR